MTKLNNDVIEEVSSDDQNTVDEAVKFINRKYENSTTEMALSIGGHVYKNIYDSDPEAVASKDPNKKVSYNKLCKHPDLGVERSQLNRMVNVFMQEEALKGGKVDLDKLTYSHRVELLKIKDVTVKVEMAKRCITEPLSIRALRDLMSKTKAEESGDEVETLEITSQTMARFEASEKAIEKIDELIAEADVKDLVTVTRNNLHKKAISLQKLMTDTAGNLTKLIEEIDEVAKEK